MNGQYIYSGFNTTTQTYNASNVYQGSASLLNVQVDNNRTMQVGISGSSVFEAGGNNLFTTLTNLVTTLNTAVTDSDAFNTNLATYSAELGTLQDNVLNVRSQNGSNINQLEALDNAASSMDLQYTKELSAIQDLDYAQAISDLGKNQLILQAAQKSFVTTTSLSLFNYLN
jgi:flagellar hook-associated protein 3 FlgL